MKLQIDTTNKTIQVIDNSIGLSDLIAELEVLLPNGLWKEYKLVNEKDGIPKAIIYSTPPNFGENLCYVSCENPDISDEKLNEVIAEYTGKPL